MKKVNITTPNERLVTIYTVNDPIEAELIRNTLLENEIRCEIDGEHQAGFTSALSIGLLVRESDSKRAKEVIDEYHPPR